MYLLPFCFSKLVQFLKFSFRQNRSFENVSFLSSKCLTFLYLEFARLRAKRAYVPTWSTCQRACVPTCLRSNLLKACQLLIFTWQCANKCANVPYGVTMFQSFLLQNATGNLCTLIL